MPRAIAFLLAGFLFGFSLSRESTHAVNSAGAEGSQAASQPPPQYPRLAQRLGIEGKVRLEGIISADGSVREVRVLKGHPILARAAVDTIKQWRFRPTVRKGKAAPVKTEFKLVFRLPRADVKAEIAIHRESVRKNPEDAEARMKLAWALQQKKEMEGAILQYQEALRLNSDDPLLRVDLGSAFFASGKFDQALTEFQAATATDPELACGYFGIWLVLEKIGDKAGAQEALQAASLARFK